MIFAAGFGTRMAPLTDTRPKPLIEVAGRTLLDHALAPAQAAGLAPIVVNAHYRAEQIDAALAREPVQVLIEKPEILDTGGGLKAALRYLPAGPVFPMNADAVWDGPNPYETLRESWAPHMESLLLCVPSARAFGRAGRDDFGLDNAGKIYRGEGYVYTGAQIIRTDIVGNHPERIFSMNVLWDEMMARDTLSVAVYPGSWCDVGRPSALLVAEELVRVR